MAAIICQARWSPALLVLSETGGGKERSPKGMGVGQRLGGCLPRRDQCKKQESIVDSEEEGKRDLGNSNQDEGTAGLPLSPERSRRLVKSHSGGWKTAQWK